MADLKISRLYAAVTSWAIEMGAENLQDHPGLWHMKTRKTDGISPIDVRINAHKEEIDGVPPFYVQIGMDDYFPGLIGIVGPSDGFVVHSRETGENEDGLIAHFVAQSDAVATRMNRLEMPTIAREPGTEAKNERA